MTMNFSRPSITTIITLITIASGSSCKAFSFPSPPHLLHRRGGGSSIATIISSLSSVQRAAVVASDNDDAAAVADVDDDLGVIMIMVVGTNRGCNFLGGVSHWYWWSQWDGAGYERCQDDVHVHIYGCLGGPSIIIYANGWLSHRLPNYQCQLGFECEAGARRVLSNIQRFSTATSI